MNFVMALSEPQVGVAEPLVGRELLRLLVGDDLAEVQDDAPIGDRQGDLQLLDVDAKGRRVKVVYQGEEKWLSMKENGVPAQTIAEAAHNVGIPAQPSDGIANALAATTQLNLEIPPRILVTGSLYLAGEVLAANGTPPT